MSKITREEALTLMTKDDGNDCLVYPILEQEEKFLSITFNLSSEEWAVELWNDYQDYHYGTMQISEETALNYINQQLQASDDVKKAIVLKVEVDTVIDDMFFTKEMAENIGSIVTISKPVEHLDGFYTIVGDDNYNAYHVSWLHFINQQPQLNDDVEKYIKIIQGSCAECKYSCWYKGDYDLDACELNKNMNELDLNSSMIGDGCPLPNLIKQHIQTQASEIERLKEQKINDDIDFAKLEVLYEIQKKLARSHCKKLNAIREVDKKLSKMEWTSRQARALRYEKEVKQILKEQEQ